MNTFNNQEFLGAEGHMFRGEGVYILLNGNGLDNRPELQRDILNRFGFDYNQPPYKFPYAKYLEIVEYLRTRLYGLLEPEAAYREMGYRASQTYFQGMQGQVFRITARIMGPQRGARHFVKSMQNTLPWDNHELVEIKPNFFRYQKTYSGGPPALMLGFIQSSVEASGVELIRATYRFSGDEPKQVIYEAEWK